jgi:hypothetical protein
MGRYDQQMLKLVLDAFVAESAEQSDRVQMDDEVDGLYEVLELTMAFMSAHPIRRTSAMASRAPGSTSSASPISQRTSPRWSSSWCAASTCATQLRALRRRARIAVAQAARSATRNVLPSRRGSRR